ncbi:uncharacterized protein ALTATR162_LOCUS1864 [Alternaria atra]|uniref:WD40 repeat-like protein n=1 Tax=Alternaria atra TaxID=119953 RepID=A0A8J2N2I0_9PLEO|nr:uncharacterized protein ALTATR162_LOCUS1864 [Alternaria atra]CAG5146352.1 unnamed protein product [Alternaria atra]
MADATPQLKRKAEEAAAQKRAKKQRKNEAAAAALHEGRNGESTNGATGATPKSKTTPKKQSNPAPKANGASKDATTGSTTDVHKTTKKSQAQKNASADKLEDQDTSANGSAEPAEVNGTLDKSGLSKAALKKQEKKERKERNRQERNELMDAEVSGIIKKKKSKTERWISSRGHGGWFLPADPVFSPDEKYLIVAEPKSLHVYATETSLLANTLAEDDAGVLTAYALSPASPHLVYVAYSLGHIILWNWVVGKKAGRWNIGATVRHMAVIAQSDSSEDDLIYCHEADEGHHTISVRALRTKRQDTRTELKQVKQVLSAGAVTGIQVLLQGKYVVAATSDSLVVGKRVKANKTALEDFEYVWREFKFSKHITTFSVYHREQQETSNGKKTPQDQRDVLDIAVGEETGVILLFEDILASFAAIEKSKKEGMDNAESFRPKRLHWHRDAVGSVKWSLDGNYLISGGDETVLTIWQLATGQPQHLPHLSAAIENVVVSPTGSAYALTLANNSVIVLSTTELDARTNIVGIQSRRIDIEQLPKDTKSGMYPVPMAVNPANPTEVFFSVPSSQPRQKKKEEDPRPEPYLQTFDLGNDRAKGRQALTRNNATEPNVAPDGRRIKEPTVTHLQVSHDGEWLATIDEWVPPRSDTRYLNEGVPEFNEQERLNRREVYLKFWRRDKSTGQWKLETRIDAPHFFEDVCGNGRVFDLVADPAAAGFATVGEDHVVRIWRPKTRSRDGVIVRGAQQEGLVTWSLDQAIEINDKLDITEGSQQSLPPRTSRLAFSSDGSVLATSISWDLKEDAGVTHLIDAHSATIRRSLTEIDVTALSGLGFVGQFLVVVADAVTVWDMVSDELAYSIPIDTPGIGRLERVPLVRLACNDNDIDGTFAVSLPRFEKNGSSRLFVYSPEHQKPVWKDTYSGVTLGLASRRSESGYVVLDSRSCLRTITPSAGSLQLPTPPPEQEEMHRIPYPVDDEEEEAGRPLANLLVSNDLTQDTQRDEHVFSMQDLQNVLHDGSVPPPPQGLFSNILALIGGKPQKASA